MKIFLELWLCFSLVFSVLEAKSRKKEESSVAWEIPQYIWNGGVMARCDKGVDSNPIKFYARENATELNGKYYKNVKKGSILWVKCCLLRPFYFLILPEIKNSFVLVLSGGDESFPSQSGLTQSEFKSMLEDDRLIHIFAQNCDYGRIHPKITHLPIGIDFHTIAYKSGRGGWGQQGSPIEQEKELIKIIQNSKPTPLRKKRIFVDFQHSDTLGKGGLKRYLQTGEDRTSIFHQILLSGLIDYTAAPLRRSELWAKKSEYAFSVSPHGNGLDCHRTWEDLALGCIVIVKTSPLDPLYEGLPVVIVQDWREINEINLEMWLEKFKDVSTNVLYREKLTHQYWIQRIRMIAERGL